MNRKGIALILGYLVIVVLTMMGAVFLSRSVMEGRLVIRHSDSAQAFWIAEAGLSRAFHDLSTGGTPPTTSVAFGNGTYQISLTQVPPPPAAPSLIIINSDGTYGTDTRTVQASFYRIASYFDNTISGGNDLDLIGAWAQLIVHGKTRLGGDFDKDCIFCDGDFDDLQEDYNWGNPNNDPLLIPDYNGNGTNNEFADFKLFGQAVVNSYPPDEVVYVQTSGSVDIYPQADYAGKKVIYVEGPSAGQGDVNIYFDASWQDGQDLTVISTGDVTYVQPLEVASNSRLSVIAWSGYNEGAIIYSTHQSVVYSHDDIDGLAILAQSSVEGNYIANSDMDYLAGAVELTFNYSDRSKNGDIPPGYAFLAGASGTPKLTGWHELID